MKKLMFVPIIFIIVLFVLAFFTKSTTPFTNVIVKNSSSKDSVKVYVTLQSPNSVIGLFGIKDTIGSKSKGYFYAIKGYEYKSNYTTKLLGVVIGFGGDNLPCAQAVQQGYKNGINVFEFSINTNFEVFDISCEDGVNSVIRVSVSDSLWTTGDGVNIHKFKSTQNKLKISDNNGIDGVFPYRCTDCTNKGSAVPQNCFNLPTTCNAVRNCQVARTGHKGGNILIQILK